MLYCGLLEMWSVHISLFYLRVALNKLNHAKLHAWTASAGPCTIVLQPKSWACRAWWSLGGVWASCLLVAAVSTDLAAASHECLWSKVCAPGQWGHAMAQQASLSSPNPTAHIHLNPWHVCLHKPKLPHHGWTAATAHGRETASRRKPSPRNVHLGWLSALIP